MDELDDSATAAAAAAATFPAAATGFCEGSPTNQQRVDRAAAARFLRAVQGDHRCAMAGRSPKTKAQQAEHVRVCDVCPRLPVCRRLTSSGPLASVHTVTVRRCCGRRPPVAEMFYGAKVPTSRLRVLAAASVTVWFCGFSFAAYKHVRPLLAWRTVLRAAPNHSTARCDESGGARDAMVCLWP